MFVCLFSGCGVVVFLFILPKEPTLHILGIFPCWKCFTHNLAVIRVSYTELSVYTGQNLAPSVFHNQMGGSVNTNTVPIASSTDESYNASMCLRFMWEESFLLGSGFVSHLLLSNSLLLVQHLLPHVHTEAHNAQPEMCENPHPYMPGNSLRVACQGGKKVSQFNLLSQYQNDLFRQGVQSAWLIHVYTYVKYCQHGPSERFIRKSDFPLG